MRDFAWEMRAHLLAARFRILTQGTLGPIGCKNDRDRVCFSCPRGMLVRLRDRGPTMRRHRPITTDSCCLRAEEALQQAGLRLSLECIDQCRHDLACNARIKSLIDEARSRKIAPVGIVNVSGSRPHCDLHQRSLPRETERICRAVLKTLCRGSLRLISHRNGLAPALSKAASWTRLARRVAGDGGTSACHEAAMIAENSASSPTPQSEP